jgi:hypothetical protein
MKLTHDQSTFLMIEEEMHGVKCKMTSTILKDQKARGGIDAHKNKKARPR